MIAAIVVTDYKIYSDGGAEDAKRITTAACNRTITLDKLQKQVKSNTLPAVRTVGTG